MKHASNVVMLIALILMAQGVVALFYGYNFLTGTRYGRSLMPICIILAGIVIGLLGLVIGTIAHMIGASRTKNDE